MKTNLSICYPTFNRAEIIYKNVKHCLQYEGDNIEVVVQDNNSTDNTEELLSRIKDKRFRYFRNDTNIGTANIISVIRKAKSDFALIVSDEDIVIIENIQRIIEVLISNNKCGIISASALVFGKPYKTYSNELKEKGFASVNRIYMHTYMSGYIYNTELVNCMETDKWNRLLSFTRFANYAFLYLAFLVLADSPLYTSEIEITNHIDEGSHDVRTYYSKSGKPVYSSQGRYEVMKYHIDCIMECGFTMEERYALLLRTIIILWSFGAVGCLESAIETWENTPDFGKLNIEKDYNPKCEMEKLERQIVDYAKVVGLIDREDKFYNYVHINSDKYNEYVKKKNFYFKKGEKLHRKYLSISSIV